MWRQISKHPRALDREYYRLLISFAGGLTQILLSFLNPHQTLVSKSHRISQNRTWLTILYPYRAAWSTAYYSLTGKSFVSTVLVWVCRLSVCLCFSSWPTGTAGYGTNSWSIGSSYADEPVLTPVMYDPDAPAGKRWSSDGFSASTVPRMYHSTAILLPDGQFQSQILPGGISSCALLRYQALSSFLGQTLMQTTPLDQT